MTDREAVSHLVRVHGNRAEKLILNLLEMLSSSPELHHELSDRELELWIALRDRVKEGEYT